MYIYINESNLAIDACDNSKTKLITSVSLSVICLNIAKMLFKNPKRTYSKELLTESVSPDKLISISSLSVNMMKLRKKLISINPRIAIQSSPKGYKLVLPDDISVLQSDKANPCVIHRNLRKQEEQSQKGSNSRLSHLSAARLGDIFLSVLILIYSCALYYSLY